MPATRRGTRQERGSIPFPLALGIGLGITIVVVVPLTVWALSRSSGPKLTVLSAAAVRAATTNDVTVTVNYLVHYPSTAYAASLTSSPTLTCVIVQDQLTGQRSFTGVADVAGTTQDNSGTLTISVPSSQHSIQGAFSLICQLARDGNQLAAASGPTVTVPAPSFSGPSGSSGSTGTSGSPRSSGSTGTSGSTRSSGSTGTSGSTRSSGATGTSGATHSSGATGAAAGPSGATGGGTPTGFGCPNLGGTTLFAGGKVDKTSDGGFDFVCNYSKDGYDAGQIVAYWYTAAGVFGQVCPLAQAGEKDDGVRTSGTLVSASKLAYVTYYFYDPGNDGAVPKAGVVALAHNFLALSEAAAYPC